jgi:hypothetical protein
VRRRDLSKDARHFIVKENCMALLADSYISPVLLNTLMRREVPALAENERLEKELRRFCPSLILLRREEAKAIMSKSGSLIYTSAENMLPILVGDSNNKVRNENIMLFKDKVQFRRLMSELYPDYFFAEVRSGEDVHLPKGRSFVVKPASGLFSLGIRKVEGEEQLKQAIEEISKEIESNSHIFPPEVVSSERFLVEEYLTGDEYAFDAYFNSRSKPVVLGIYRHPLLNESDFRDVVYYTSADIMKDMLPRVEGFLKELSSHRKLKNFPLHGEFRVKDDQVMPIEINPMRFGGLSLSDLLFFAYQINPYAAYFLREEPDWNNILSKADGETCFWVDSSIPAGQGEIMPDHDEYAATFKELLGYCKLDPKRYTTFSIAFAKTKEIGEAMKYLSFNFEDYIERK